MGHFPSEVSAEVSGQRDAGPIPQWWHQSEQWETRHGPRNCTCREASTSQERLYV